METGAAEKLVLDALAGRESALVRLVDLLTPVIQARVARLLLTRRTPRQNGRVRADVEDLTQDIFLLLFADDGRVLRSWQPGKGLSLENFVGLVARRRTLSSLRTSRANPWREQPAPDAELERQAGGPGPEARAATREQLAKLLERLQEELSPLGWRLFELVWIEERSVDEIRQRTGMSADAVYAWRSRLRRTARALFRGIVSEGG